MQAPAPTKAPPSAATANSTATTNSTATVNSTATANSTATTNNTAGNPLDKIRGLTRFEKDVDETVSLYFQNIVQRLTGPLLVTLRKSKKNFRPFAIRLLVLGVDESAAKPYIVVFCPACVRDLVENYFLRETPKRLCQPGKDGPASFDVIVEGTPIQLTTSHHVHLTSINTGHSASEVLRYINTRLKIDGIHGIRYATMGGYVVVVDNDDRLSIYGLTAGHSIVQDDLEEDIESEQASRETNAGRNLFPDLITYEPSQVLQPAASQTMHNATYSHFSDSQEEIEWSGTAIVAPASFSTQACDRDWALLQAITDTSGSEYLYRQTFERYILGDYKTGTALLDNQVEVSLQPPFIGTVPRLPSFTIMLHGNDLVRVHTITVPDARKTPAGASGAWVSTEMTDPTSSIRPQSATATSPDEKRSSNITIFGQVVAYDVLGDVYMVPLCDILEDVKHVLAVQEARLPESGSEINSILRMMNSNTSQDSGGSFAAARHPSRDKCPASTESPKEEIWYCHSCGDGPKGGWQVICLVCSHQRCGACSCDEAC